MHRRNVTPPHSHLPAPGRAFDSPGAASAACVESLARIAARRADMRGRLLHRTISSAMTIGADDITAVILAGGQGRRMGGRDKGLLDFDGRPLVAILIEKLQAQSVRILINANRNESVYAAFGYPVVRDRLDDYQGPLAGFASAMAAVETAFILTLPCDSPLLAEDYAQRFIDCYTQTGAPICVAHDGERLQPVHALICVDLLPGLDTFLGSGERKIDRWYARHAFATTDFSDCAGMFRNINTPADREALGASQ